MTLSSTSKCLFRQWKWPFRSLVWSLCPRLSTSYYLTLLNPQLSSGSFLPIRWWKWWYRQVIAEQKGAEEEHATPWHPIKVNLIMESPTMANPIMDLPNIKEILGAQGIRDGRDFVVHMLFFCIRYSSFFGNRRFPLVHYGVSFSYSHLTWRDWSIWMKIPPSLINLHKCWFHTILSFPWNSSGVFLSCYHIGLVTFRS